MDAAFLELYSKHRFIEYTMNSTCSNQLSKVTSGQLAVHALASMYASSKNDNNPILKGKRGAIVYWSTGAGKACACSCIIDAFWDEPDRYPDIILVTSPAALRSNPPENFHKCAKMLPRFSKASLQGVDEAYAKRGVKFTTFAKLAHYTGVHKPSRNAAKYVRRPTLFIIDEAHTMFRPLQSQREEMKAVLNVLFGTDSNRQDKFFLLTATPGETTQEVLKMINILRDTTAISPLALPKNNHEAAAFIKECRFLVSRFDARKNRDVYPRIIFHDIRLPMSIDQYMRYREAIAKTFADDKDYDELKRQERLQRLYASARRFCNVLFQVDPKKPLETASSKLPEILKLILGHPGQKHYVYSSFGDKRGFGGQGIHAIAHVLVEYGGYEHLQQSDIELLSNVLNSGNTILPLLKKPRFVIVTPSELGTNTDKSLTNLIKLFNAPFNAKGEYIHVLLASGNFYESIDLKAVRHVHLFDPMLSIFAEDQAIGRAFRRCSHSQLPDKQEWTVTVHRYFASAPRERDIETFIEDARHKLRQYYEMKMPLTEIRKHIHYIKGLQSLIMHVNKRTVDEYIHELAKHRHEPVQKLLTLLEMAAIDCPLYNGYNSFCRVNSLR